MKYDEKLNLIFEKYGYKAQLYKLAEECSELIKAILKNDENNLIEEMADVEVLTDQIKQRFQNIKEEIEQIKEQKTQRQIERILKNEG